VRLPICGNIAMNRVLFETTILGRPVRIVGALAYVTLPCEVELIFDRITIQWMERLFPTGLLRLHHDGDGRRYVDVRCQKGSPDRLSAARIVLCLLNTPDQVNRQAH
jgi:hypothetical protein